MKKNWVYYMQKGLKSIWKKKEVPDYRREKNLAKLYNQEKNLLRQKKEYPYNIEFGDGRTKEEMDKMQKELMEGGSKK